MIRFVAALVLLIGSFAVADETVRTTVVFKERATVGATEIRLKEIATVTSSDPVLTARLEEFPVGAAPRNGVRGLVQRRNVLQALAGTPDGRGVIGEGALQTIVEVKSNNFDHARLIDTARDYLSQQLQREYPLASRVQISSVGEVADLRVPSGDIAVAPRPLQGNAMAKRVCVWLDVTVNGKVYRSVPVWLTVQAYAPVFVARRTITPRENVTASDFVLDDRDIAEVRGTALYNSKDFAGQRARTYIAAGSIVKAADLEAAPSVLAEQEVDVRVEMGPVRIETIAVAQEEGRVGDYVRVRNPSSASIFMARVVGDRSVVVTER